MSPSALPTQTSSDCKFYFTLRAADPRLLSWLVSNDIAKERPEVRWFDDPAYRQAIPARLDWREHKITPWPAALTPEVADERKKELRERLLSSPKTSWAAAAIQQEHVWPLNADQLGELRTWAEEKVKKDVPEFCLSDEKATFVIELGAATAEALDAYVEGGVPTMPHPAPQDTGPSRSMKSPGDQHLQPTPSSASISNGQEFMYGFLYQLATPRQTAESVSAPVYFYSIGPAKPTPVAKPTFHMANPCFEALLKFMAKNAKNGSQ